MEQVSKQHPNAHILRAIADGKTVQWSTGARGADWHDWSVNDMCPSPTASAQLEWRVKPEPEPLFERWYFVQSKPDELPKLISVLHRTSLQAAVAFLKGPDAISLRVYCVGLLCVTTDKHTVRKVEFFSKAELRAKGVL